MLGYGLGYSAAALFWELRNLVNPLVVGRYAGAEEVGYVALTIRLVEQLSFIIVVIWRVATVALARLQEDRARLVQAVTEGLSLQLMLLGPILAGFGLVVPWILPLLFGPRWLPVLEVYPFIALTYLCIAGVNLYSSALSVLRRNWQVATSNLVHSTLLAGAALLLVPHLGLSGYGWAEVVAIPSYILFIIWFQVYIGRVRYTQAGVWFIAWAIPLFSWQLGPWVWVSVIVPLIWPATRRELLQAVATVLRRTTGP
jgi:PST family polysaccharide transporter